MKRFLLLYILLFTVLAFSVSCSTIKAIPEGSYRLKKNVVKIEGEKRSKLSANLTPYIKQSASSKLNLGLMSLFAEKVIYDSTQIDPSIKGMKDHLEYLGYYYSDIHATTKYKKRDAEVTYSVNVGKRYPIKSIAYKVRDSVVRKFIEADSLNRTIKVGDPLCEDNLDLESDRIAKMLQDNGYYGFSKNYCFFYADTTTVKDSSILFLTIENYTRNESKSMAIPNHVRYNIGKVEIVPKDVEFKQKSIDYINRINSGDLYSAGHINNTYQRFTSNKLFRSVNVKLTPVDSNVVDCDIELLASKLQSLKLDMKASVNSSGLMGITPSIAYNHKNIFKGGENLSLGFKGNFQFMFNDPVTSNEFAINTALKFPRFLLLPGKAFKGNRLPNTEIVLSYNYQSRPEYKRNIFSASYTYGWSSNKNWSYQVTPLRFNLVRINDMADWFYENLSSKYLQYTYQNHFDLGARGVVYYTTAQETNPSYSYFYARLEGDIAGNLVSLFNPVMKVDENGQKMIMGMPYSQYGRLAITAVETFKFGKNNNMSLAVRAFAGAGYAYGNSSALPLEQTFYVGGANSMRGWQSRTLGPGISPIDTTFAIANQTGDVRFEGNVEFRFPIVWKLNGALFADVGNVWNIPRANSNEYEKLGELNWDNFRKGLAFSWGVGARLDFGLLLIRVDLGLKQYDPVDQHWRTPAEWFKNNGYAVHFGIGYPF